MKKLHSLAVVAAVVCSCACLGSAQAQVPGSQPVMRGPTAGRIALLDVSAIFDKHMRFKSMMNEMKADVERAEASVKQERETIQKMIERLEQFKGTPDYKAAEEEIAKREADLQVRISLQRKEFVQREAKIYHNVYKEIMQEVEYYCAANGVSMVLRFSGAPVDVENPEHVLRDINKPVVWYDRSLDITEIIIAGLNRGQVQPGGAPVQGVQRPGVGYRR